MQKTTKDITRIVLIFFAIIILSCTSHPKEATQKVLEGVNGPTVYVYGKDGKQLMVFKQEYAAGAFSVYLDRDTVKLGEKFSGFFAVARDSFKIIVTEPSYARIANDKENMERYYFTPDKPGLYEFKGYIELDTANLPFEYKFLVVP